MPDLLLRYEARADALRLPSCLRSEKLNGNIFFKLFFSDLDEKITSAGYELHTKGNSETSLSCPIIYLPRGVSHGKRNYSLTLDNFSLSSQQMVSNYFLYRRKSSDAHLRESLAQFWPNKHYATGRHFLDDRWDPSKVVEKMDSRELLEVHRNVIDVKSIAFLMILLAPEDSFVNTCDGI